MRYYGQSQIGIIGGISVLRYEAPANQHIYSLPMAQSNSTFRTRVDIMYLCEESGPITVTECTTNSELVGLVLQPGNTYIPELVFGNNIVKLESGNSIPVLTMFLADRKNGYSMVNVNTVSVNGSFTIPANTYAAIVEGTITISDTVADSNTDLFIIKNKDQEREVSGEGKLITFEIANGQ